MNALIGILGAAVGGVLVLIADALRQRANYRKDLVVRLVEASTAFALLLARRLAHARDAFDHDRPLTVDRPEQYEASVRFFLTAGMEELYPTAMNLLNAYVSYVQAGPAHVDRQAAADRYFQAAQAFEAKVRAVQRRGSIVRHGAVPPVRLGTLGQ